MPVATSSSALVCPHGIGLPNGRWRIVDRSGGAALDRTLDLLDHVTSLTLIIEWLAERGMKRA